MTETDRTVVTRCSLAVCPIDMWTGRTPTGSSLVVRLKETERKPIRASDGSYAFLDYDARQCTLSVASPYYLRTELPLRLDEFEGSVPVVSVLLRPNRVYPTPAAATGFIFRVTDGKGSPLSGVKVSAAARRETVNEAWTTWSDEDGSVVLPLPGRWPAAFSVTVDISQGENGFQTVWTADSGTVVRLPDVRLGNDEQV